MNPDSIPTYMSTSHNTDQFIFCEFRKTKDCWGPKNHNKNDKTQNEEWKNIIKIAFSFILVLIFNLDFLIICFELFKWAFKTSSHWKCYIDLRRSWSINVNPLIILLWRGSN